MLIKNEGSEPVNFNIEEKYSALKDKLGELQSIELPRPGKLDRRRAVQSLRGADWRKIVIVSGGVAAAASVIGLAGRYSFYKNIVAGELKKQLREVNARLDMLQEQNRELREEIALLREKQPEAGEAAAEETE